MWTPEVRWECFPHTHARVLVCCRSSPWSLSWLGAATATTEARWVRGARLPGRAARPPAGRGPEQRGRQPLSLAVGAPWRAPGGGPGGAAVPSPCPLPLQNAEYCIMVIGVPNVGKSSLINSLRRQHLGKGTVGWR